MEPILQAVQRAKNSLRPVVSRVDTPPQIPAAPAVEAPEPARAQPDASPTPDHAGWLREAELNWEHLERHRIVAHNVTDVRARAYDMLRTQTLQAMDRSAWQFLAITSPTESCGKTVTALNLAFSIARQPEREVVLVDLDLQRPKVSRYLGVKSERGVVSLLSGRSKLRDSIFAAQIGGYLCPVLPAETRSLHSSELIASRAMRSMLQEIKVAFPSAIVILDLPPLLSGDDVLSLIPHVDAFMLVAAVGHSTVSDVRECNKYLHSAEVLRVVLNKSSDQLAYYGAGMGHG